MSSHTQRILQATILIGLGIFFLVKLVTGELDNYIAQRFYTLVGTGAIGLLVLGATAYQQFRREKIHAASHAQHDQTEAHEHDHEHDHDGHNHAGSWRLLWLAVPLLLGILAPATPLNASAIFTRGINDNLIQNSSPLQLPQEPTERSVLDWVRAYNNSTDIASFAGQPADVIGFVYRDPRLPANQFLLARFTISCCVADAFAIGVVISAPEGQSFPENTWLRVQGTMTGQYAEGQQIPVLQATSLIEVPEPANPYLYQ